jgi:hypothetical protein
MRLDGLSFWTRRVHAGAFLCGVFGSIVNGRRCPMAERKERMAQRYIRLLSPLENAKGYLFTDSDETPDDLKG